MSQEILDKLKFLYHDEANEIYIKLMDLIKKYKISDEDINLTEKDIILITYGDSIQKKGEKSLQTLHNFLNKHVKGIINTVHILPFFPYSSDDGFSVIDYKMVNPNLGTWKDIESLSKDYNLMFDAVINHISKESAWFKEYLKGNQKYKDYFIEQTPVEELKIVTRPRALPLLHIYDTANGKKHIWTTFSEDQIDLNYKSKDVFLEIVEILLFYAKRGAKLIRLDAIGYLWKEIGTSCIHLEQTHKMIQLFRDILNLTAKNVILITETNVPHKENISYFGNGYNEAQMVYNFSLPPLVLHSFLSKNAYYISHWADKLETPSDKTTFFNFLASHDGIGLMPAKGILKDEEIDYLVTHTLKNNGLVSYKSNPDGSKSPYELNINYFDALYEESEDMELNIRKFVSAYAIASSLKGVPGIYIHSLLGSRNYYEGVKISGINRSINREKLNFDTLENELTDKKSFRYKIFNSMKNMLSIRINQKAFNPKGNQKILFLDNRIFSFIREYENERILVITNVSNEKFVINVKNIYSEKPKDLLSNKLINAESGHLIIEVLPYETLWIK
ncbi:MULTISPECIES: alpha-amylase family glycosyl hydrolase [unclassified Marinitoga]|uniref:alpha-amylase family glycosyl hydrolase n=1 Tax=unclassified Marinitoga TaxID=2640159 RepID=UPI000640E5FB|nr:MULTISPECIES: alpha-amylase family glycosyl hydrolase [unclassified Marinitoga]KLO24115.1 sucrose phosphorylase [Marinitoga sp. 1155]NUU99343.1 sugar phosphorylase [Marinitoga sp. 1154]